uniref:Uncharacterized protein n=1 Tax=Daphnia galeata TaxID=27404 RepID=A0A8J2S1Y4_9CRUS|nr:unnamed protein product [Daphnia galeata]
MEVTYYLLFFFLVLMFTGMDGVQTGNVLLPQALRAIKKDGGIRRPLMRNDQPNGIYLMSDQRQPPLVTLRTHIHLHLTNVSSCNNNSTNNNNKVS